MVQSRREFLTKGAAIGCSLAASPLVTPVTFASAPGEGRLVVIILRGGMDGLDVVRPAGDRLFASYRPKLAGVQGPALDDYFQLHPEMADLLPMWTSAELGFAHAVSTPYRDKRSHFDGQDFLENGGSDPSGLLTSSADGWLNRALAGVEGARIRTAFAVGRENLLLLNGPNAASSWAPNEQLGLSPQAELLLREVYKNDPLFAQAAEQAIALSELTDTGKRNGRRQSTAERLAAFAAERLLEETRIAAFSIGGWDTHAGQSYTMQRTLRGLSAALMALKTGLGRHWETTLVLGLTEFGRTVRENGSAGTDHGTGGAAILAGGALHGGKVFGDWPGLESGALYEDRDLMPTRDLRAYPGWALAGLFGLSKSAIEGTVFPGRDMGSYPGLLL